MEQTQDLTPSRRARPRTVQRLAAYRLEAGLAREAIRRRDPAAAMRHLERAHILGQPWPGPHSWTHWMMLRVGLSAGDGREVAGQLLRLAAGGLLSILGWLPDGNTGRARVSSIRPMPPPADLAELCGRGEAS